MKHWRSILAVGLSLLIAVSGLIAWRVWPRQRVSLTDARNIRTPESNAQVRDILWDVPEPADAILRLTDGSTDYAIDGDERRLVFVRGRGASSDVYMRQRTGDQWSPAELIDSVSSEDSERSVALSADGNTLVLSSDRPGAVGGFDLYISRFSKGAWGTPAPIAGANSRFDDIDAAISRHGTQLVFASNRPVVVGGEGAASVDTASQPAEVDGSFNLYCVDLLADAPPTLIDSANSARNELSPAFSSAEDFLYFASDRSSGVGGYDLYRLRLLGDGFGAPEHLDATINTPRDELDPALGVAGFRLTYRSSGGDEEGARLLQSTSREVFRDVTYERGTIDWAALWRQIAPNLLWALLALILTLLFLAMMRDFRDRKFSLLARCLLASLLAHLVLMLLFNVLKVSTTIASAIGGRETIRVSLMSEASAGEIGQQIRGEFVDVATVSAEVASAERAALQAEPIETRTDVEVAPAPSETLSDVPSDAALTLVEAADAPSETQVADAPMPSQLADIVEALAARDYDDVALPEPSAGATQPEAAIPAGVALVGETALDSPVAPTQLATTQPSGAMSIDVGVEAIAEAPTDSAAASQIVDAVDATPTRDAGRVAAVALASIDELPAMPFAAEVAIPGSSAVESSHGEEGGLAVSSVDVARPGRAALAMSESSPGASVVELAVPVSDAEGFADSPAAMPVESIADADGAAAPTAPADRPFDVDVAAPAIELAIALPGAEDDADAGRRSAAADGGDESSVLLDDPGFASALPSASEALAESQRGSVSLATLGIESDTTWVTAGAEQATRRGETRDAEADASPIGEGVAQDAEVPVVRVALGVGIPDAPPPRPDGIRRGMIGRIVGTVEDAETGRGLSQSRVLLALQDDQSIVVESDEHGAYEIQVPQVPDHFALSASRGGYVPESRNINADKVRGRTITVNFALSRQTELVIALEDEPDVHHLGNDRFEGRINSQFQKQTQGRTYRASFEVTREQLPPNYAHAEVILMVKGVQCPHQVRINGRLVRERLADSPTDGSFGEYRASFDPGWLIEGRNAFKIRARSCGGDLDDFEFVNVQIRLRP